MAKAVIIDSRIAKTSSVNTSDYSNTSIDSIDHNAKIIDIKHHFKVKEEVDYPITKVSPIPIYVNVEDILPFRIKFTNIGIEAYGPNNPAPIGIAIIGVSNYIL